VRKGKRLSRAVSTSADVCVSLVANQDVTSRQPRQQTAYPARETKFFPMSYRNCKHIIRQARSKYIYSVYNPYIYIFALSRFFSYNQTLRESLTDAIAEYVFTRDDDRRFNDKALHRTCDRNKNERYRTIITEEQLILSSRKLAI